MQVASSSYFSAYSPWPNPTQAQRSPGLSQAPAADPPVDDQSTADQSTLPLSERTPQKTSAQQQVEQLELAKLIRRDQEVRLHEQAHAAVGGSYAGAPTYTFERGTDGKRYAVAGEVGIDLSVVLNDPQATVRKMETVIRAALSPAQPSAQDRQIAAQAQIQMAEARAELAQVQREQSEAAREARTQEREDEEQKEADSEGQTAASDASGALELYRQSRAVISQTPLVDLDI